jgi:DNA-binding NarL/FixJ family response regulator
VADIATAIERAATGEMLIPAATLTQLMRHARERARERQDRARLRASLTDRERDVLRAMASGDDTALMAETLKISRHTTRGYVQTIIEKLGAHSRLEAVLRAQQLGLLED